MLFQRKSVTYPFRLALLAMVVFSACFVTGTPEDAPQDNNPQPPPAVSETDSPQDPVENPADPNAVPRFEFETCVNDYSDLEVELDCGTLIAWENRDLASGTLVKLPVVILYSNSDDYASDPLVYLSGGPGGSGIEVESWLGLPFLGDRDMILFDQRGTGEAEPSLNCIEFDDDESQNPDADCLNRLLSLGIDLTMYNSASSAADVAELMRTLGYDSYNLIGISYGTRLALTVMRDHPEGLRAVVLDSVYPPHVDGYAEEAISGWNAAKQLFAACSADPECDDFYPDLENVFLDTIEMLNNNPAETDTGDIYGADFVSIIVQALYDNYQIPFIPLAIYDTYDGYFDTLLDLSDGVLSYGRLEQDEDADTDSEGVYNSVQCREEAPFTSDPDLQALSSTIPEPARAAFLESVYFGLDTCNFWASGESSDIENQPVQSSIPTLLLSGIFDPVTPPIWAESAASYLSSSFVFAFPGVGHSVVDSSLCAQEITVDFLRSPNTAPNSTCIAETPDIEFYYP